MTSRREKLSQLKNPHKNIIIAMEGSVTEPKYFNKIQIKFKKSKVNIKPLPRSNTNSDPQHVIDQLNNYIKNKNNVIDASDEFWLIIDTESPANRSPELLNKIANDCDANNYYLGISNPCFEI